MSAFPTLTQHTTRRRNVSQPDMKDEEWRLPHNHRQDLRDVAYGVEETEAGVCTKYLLDELERGGPPEEGDIALFEAEAFVEQHVMNTIVLEKFGRHVYSWRNRIIRCRHVLAAMSEVGDHWAVGVLHSAYGPVDPITKDWPKSSMDFLGRELVSLVRYTEETERVRKTIVRELAIPEPNPEHPGHLFAIRNLETKLEPVVSDGTIDLGRVREREIRFDRIVSSGDALLRIFREVPVPCLDGESKIAHQERRAFVRNAESVQRAAFLTAARYEASRMLARASRLYHAVWQVVKA